MTLTQLEYVVAVDQHRHFARAAQACHITQPTLSMQIKKLEDSLGVNIFDRSKAPVIPTAEGLIVLEHARRILSEVRALSAHLSDSEGVLTGEFRVGIIPTLAPYVLPLFLDAFAAAHPKLELIVEEYKTEEIIGKLQRDEIDVGLLATPLEVEGLEEEVLFYEPFYVFVSRHHPLFKQSRIRPSELRPDEIWLLAEGHCFRDQVLDVCGSVRRAKEGGRHLRFESGNLETLKNLVANGSGYTLLPHLALANLTKAQRRMVRSFSGTTPTREVSLVYSRTQYRKRAIAALKESILDHVPDGLVRERTKGVSVIGISRGP